MIGWHDEARSDAIIWLGKSDAQASNLRWSFLISSIGQKICVRLQTKVHILFYIF